MMQKLSIMLALTVACCIVTQSASQTPGKEETEGIAMLSDQDKEALELGRKVINVKAALQTPEKRTSIEAIRDLGLDSRYYIMVRGWIRQHISMTESYRGTTTYHDSEDRKKEVDGRIKALQKALRAIDLE